jgi:general secretion pathway protein K
LAYLNPKSEYQKLNVSMTTTSTYLCNHKGEISVSRKAVIRTRRREAGMALIAVLWVLVLLTAIVAEFAYSMRTEVNITRNFREAAQAHYIAHSGVIRAVVAIVKNANKAKNEKNADEVAPDTAWRVNAAIAPQRFGSGQFSVHIDNAAGLINLNTATDSLLRLMVNTLDISDTEKAVIVDSILDWRDSDDLHRLHGAENNYYLSLPSPYACKNSAFDVVEELLLVRGIHPELFYKKLRSIVIVTPDSKIRQDAKHRTPHLVTRAVAGQININAAPRQLLEALPQITAEQIQNLMDYRIDRDLISMEEIRYLIGEQTFSVISPYITLDLSPYYTIRAEGRVSGSPVRQIIRAVVKIDPKLPDRYQVVSWQDRYF